MRIKIAVKLAVVLASCLLASGCWDRREINDVAFVLSMTVDLAEEGFRVGILVPLPGNMGGPSGGGGGSGGDQPYTFDSEVGKTLREAVEKMQNRSPRQLYFAHRRVILLGERLAERGIRDFLDSAVRMPENRLTTHLVVTKGEAYRTLNKDIKMERFSAEAIRELVQSDATIPVTVKDVLYQINTVGSDVRIPYMEVKDSKYQFTGIVIMSDGRMVGVAKGDVESGLRYLCGKFVPYSETLTVEDSVTSVKVMRGSRQVRPVISGDRIRFDVRIKSRGVIMEVINQGHSRIDEAKAGAALEAKIRSDVEKTLRYLQDHKSDAAGFGQVLNRFDPLNWETTWSKQWYSVFPQVEFHVSVDAEVDKAGMLWGNVAEQGD
ncbi:Ger(x)C family spore germination protein [Paenibacillus thermoaerophilus]|uniref:Ger(X)C family spore germination protein n=1 Tax=Paenibacillus thermoaerophilus TaxID=1215385 RepID=A0ABW2V3Q2_9BACL|nr:Ger(x)C family spore germination protein [Paenibacillus thermoaerophilus]TMV12033.1 Ger(x)C family spore germination protein [Paenibacillus thermoaerophilus]